MRIRHLAAVLLVLALPAGASAASLPADTTAVISGTSDLRGLPATPVSDSFVGSQSASQDGNLIAFASRSDGLFAGDDDDVINVYVKNVATGAVQLVSRADGAGGAAARSNCSEPVISDDGTRVAFTCDGALDPADTNGVADVYVRDIAVQHTILVSRASAVGDVGDGESNAPSIDGTGAHVAFVTVAGNLGDGVQPGDTLEHIYRRTIGNGDGTVLISRGNAQQADPIDQDSENPSIDDSGAHVAFDTEAGVDPADDNNDGDVYVRDVGAGTTALVSRAGTANGAVGNGESGAGLISGNGLFVAFTSEAGNFDAVHDPDPGENDVYRRSLAANTTTLISAKADGTKGNGTSFATGIDDSGDVVAFASSSSNLDPGVTSEFSVEAYVRKGNALLLASRRDGPAGAPSGGSFGGAVSGDGTKAVVIVAALTSDVEPRATTVAVRDLVHATTRAVARPQGAAPFVNAGGFGSAGSVSADGRFVAFTSDARALGVPDNVARAVFVRDTVTGAVTIASRADGARGAVMDGFPNDPQISADGRRVTWWLSAGDLTDVPAEILVRDIPTGRTFIASRADGPQGAVGNGFVADTPTISDDGSRVAFATSATNLGDGDTDQQVDVHVRDLNTGRTFLVSRADGANGAKAAEPSEDPAISGNGRRVAFATRAPLGGGDADASSDVYVRTIDAGSTLLASVTGDATKGNDASRAPSISRDGNRVSFLSAARNFDNTPPGTKLYVRDIAAHTLKVAGRADGASGAVLTDDVTLGRLSADGASIAFLSNAAASVAGGDPADGTSRLFVRNLTSGVTRLVSRATGAAGAAVPKRSGVTFGGITADGGCVAFSTDGRLLAPPASADFDQVYLRVLRPDCGRPPVVPSKPVRVDRTAPRLSKVRLSRTHVRRGHGTVLSLRVSEASRLTVTVARERRGRRPVRDGTLRRSLKAGKARIAVGGRLGGKRLAVGRHRLTLVARDAAGNASRPIVVRLTVVR